MTKNNRDLEILIALLIMLLSIAFFSFAIWLMFYQLESFRRVIRNPEELSWFTILYFWYTPLVTNILSFIGGIYLLRNKIIGWYLVSCYAIYSTILLIGMGAKQVSAVNGDNWILYLISIFFLLITIFMFSNQVRQKYSINKKSFVIVFIALFFLLVNRYLIS